MREDTIKVILRSLCRTSEGNFEVVISDRHRGRTSGIYQRGMRRITIYPRRAPYAMIAVALHELAHHLVYERYPGLLEGQFHQGKPHGKEFKNILDELLGAFNSQYREHLKGKLVYDRRKPRIRPKFVPFENSQHLQNIGMRQ